MEKAAWSLDDRRITNVTVWHARMETRKSTRSDRTGKIRGDNVDGSKNGEQDDETDLPTHRTCILDEKMRLILLLH